MLNQDIIDIVLRKMDHDKDGHICFNDFKKTVGFVFAFQIQIYEQVDEEPLLLEAFGPCLPTDGAQTKYWKFELELY